MVFQAGEHAIFLDGCLLGEQASSVTACTSAEARMEIEAQGGGTGGCVREAALWLCTPGVSADNEAQSELNISQTRLLT